MRSALVEVRAAGEIVVKFILAAPDLALRHDAESRAIEILRADVDPGSGQWSPLALKGLFNRLDTVVRQLFAETLDSVEGRALSSVEMHIYAPVNKSNVRIRGSYMNERVAESFRVVKEYVFGASPTIFPLLRAAIRAAGQLRHRTSEREVLHVFSSLRWLLERFFSIAALERHLASQSGAAPAASSTSSSSDSDASDPLLVDKFLDEAEIQSFLNAM